MDGGPVSVVANTKEVAVTPKAASEVVVDIDLGP
jgi:hypothetical protein